MPPRASKENPNGFLHYCEPFFGGGAVLLANNPTGISEVVNDLDTGLTNFWRVLACPVQFPEFQRRAQATPFCEAIWEDAGHILSEDSGADELTQAVAFFVRARQSMAGRENSFAPLSRTRIRSKMNEQASAWLTAVEGLTEVHERMKRVVIVGPKDGKEVIRQQDGEQTLHYCDCPYLDETRASPDVYTHEMSRADHVELLETLANVKGKFLLSGYWSPLYDTAAGIHGWKCHRFELPNNSASGDTKRRVVECLWSNY
jgi:DNA adenine methylase